jgi:hypothetical protein
MQKSDEARTNRGKVMECKGAGEGILRLFHPPCHQKGIHCPFLYERTLRAQCGRQGLPNLSGFSTMARIEQGPPSVIQELLSQVFRPHAPGQSIAPVVGSQIKGQGVFGACGRLLR